MFFKRRHQFFTRRITHTVNLRRERRMVLFSRIGSAALFGALLIFVIAYSFQGGATTAQLYPGACSGTWIQPAHAQGKPDLDFNASPDAFTPDNSAFVVRDNTDQKQIFCSNFSGDPLLASSSPQLVTLRLSWAIGPKDHSSSSASGAIVQQAVDFVPSPQVLEQIASSSASSAPALISGTSSPAVPPESSSSSATSDAVISKDVRDANSLTVVSSSSAGSGEGNSVSASSSSPASATQLPEESSPASASTTPPSVSTAPDSGASNTSSAPPADSTSSSVSSPPPVPASAPAQDSIQTSAPASSSTSLLWNLLSPFFLRAFAQEVSTTPLADATASTPVLLSAPATSSSPSPTLGATNDQSSATTTSGTNQSASTSTPAVLLPATPTTSVASSSPDQPGSSSPILGSSTERASSTASSSLSSLVGQPLTSENISSSSTASTSLISSTPAMVGVSDPTSTPHSDATSTPAVPMFEIRYSLDGSTWDVLADVTPDQMGQTFVVPVSSNDDIAKLQIAVVTLDLSPLSLDQAAYVDGMTLQVTYPNRKEKDTNELSSYRKQLVSSGGAFDSVQLQDDDFSHAGTGIVSCAADPFSQTVAVNGTAQYAINLSGPSDAQFDFAGAYGKALAAPMMAPVSSASSSASSTGDVGTASSAQPLPPPDASSGTSSDATNTIAIATNTSATTSGLNPASSTPALSKLMPFLITLGDYPQGIAPVLSRDASGTPLVSFSADKTALPGSYTLIVRVLAKYHGQVQKALCQLNLIVK